MSIYVHRNHQAYQGRGAKDSHLDFHTAPGCEQLGRWSWVLTAWTDCLAAAAEFFATVGSLWIQSLPVTFGSAQLLKKQVIYGLHKFFLYIFFSTIVQSSPLIIFNNNNNKYLERLSPTGPKRLHSLYKHILSKFNIQHLTYNMNARTHTHTRRAHTRPRPHTYTHTTYQGNGTEEMFFKKTKVCSQWWWHSYFPVFAGRSAWDELYIATIPSSNSFFNSGSHIIMVSVGAKPNKTTWRTATTSDGVLCIQSRESSPTQLSLKIHNMGRGILDYNPSVFIAWSLLLKC